MRTPAEAVSPRAALDVSVIIVNYNVKHFLLQCLRSVEQALKGLSGEIIVIARIINDVAGIEPSCGNTVSQSRETECSSGSSVALVEHSSD